MPSFETRSSNQHLSPEKWNEGLVRHLSIPEPGNSGLILSEISLGMRELWKRHATPEQKLPRLGVPCEPLPDDWASFEGKMFYTHKNGEVVATRLWLHNMRKLPTNTDVSLVGEEGNGIYLKGRLPELAFLNGVEEADHALWRMDGLKAPERSADSKAGTQLAKYDAYPVEFRALQRQIKIAESLKFQNITISILKERIINAERVQKLLS